MNASDIEYTLSYYTPDSYDEDTFELTFLFQAEAMLANASTPEAMRDWFICLRPEDFRKGLLHLQNLIETQRVPAFPVDWDAPDSGYEEGLESRAQSLVDTVGVVLYAVFRSHHRDALRAVYSEVGAGLLAAREALLCQCKQAGFNVERRIV